MIATTLTRVTQNTSETVNESIRRQTEARVAHYAAMGSTEIERRLLELSEEWDIERWLETMAPTLTLVGMLAGLMVNRKFFVLPLVIQAFFLQHAIQGWCPPIPVLRRLGVRTQVEIDEERCALKALRGDFRHVTGQGSVNQALAAAHR